MFDNNTKTAWQGVSPDPSLKARVLQQAAQQRKVISFPAKAARRVAAAAACLVLALVLLNPAPQVSLVGTGPGVAMAAYSRQMPEQQGMTLVLETSRNATLTTEDGWVEQNGTTALWHLPGDGEYTLIAVSGRRSTEFCVEVTITEEGRSVKVK